MQAFGERRRRPGFRTHRAELTLRGTELQSHRSALVDRGLEIENSALGRDREFGAFTETENSAGIERIRRFYIEREITGFGRIRR